ncbi:uncharacterized protein [Argopecten irradians]|uniref:uncharacterized protein isoform X2 n=1 Tax=Argopecten irradians TaxID=31199 RepID=UPI0037237362
MDMHQQLSEDGLDRLGYDGLYFCGGISESANQVITTHLDKIINTFDYNSIKSGETLKCVLHELRRCLLGYLDTLLAPEQQAWRDLLNIIEDTTSIPLGDLEKARDITDIINILKTAAISKRRFQPYSCLMKSVSRVDRKYAKRVGPLYNKIVMLDKRYRASVTVKMNPQLAGCLIPKDRVGQLSITVTHVGFDTENSNSEEEESRDGERLRHR